MVVFNIGNNSLTNKSFEHVVKSKIENIVNFFGEKYRKKIEEKFKNTCFVITNRYTAENNLILDALNEFLKLIGADMVSDLVPNFLNKKDKFSITHFIHDKLFNWWKFSESKLNVKDEIGYRAFWASYFENEKAEGKNIDELRKNFNNPEFIEKLQQKVDSVDIKGILEKALDKWFYVYSEPIFDTMKDIKYNEETKLYLNMKQRKCRKVLADFFGSDRLRNIKVDSVFYDISDIFIDYITKKQDLMDYEDYLKYIEMFESLTGIDESSIIEESDDPLEMYEKKFSWEIKHAKDKLMKIFADIDKERKDRKMNSTLPELNKFLKEQALPIDVDSGKIIEHLRNYINASGDGTAAYCSTIIKDEGFFNLIVLPDDFQLYATHEMLHAVSENFTFDFDRALDEVITEFFATKIDDTKIQKEHSKLDIIYSAAIPLVEKFFNDNLERIKSFYISGSHVLFKIYIGYQNYEALCNALTELLNLSKNVLHSYHRTKQVLKDPSLYKNDKYVKAVYKVQQIIQDIENYIAEKNHQNFPIEI